MNTYLISFIPFNLKLINYAQTKHIILTNNILSDIFWEEPNVYKNDQIRNSKSHLNVRYNVCTHHSHHKPYIIRISRIYSDTM